MPQLTTNHDAKLFQTIEERHSVKQYEKGFKISEKEKEQILTAAALAPSSWNLQHWKFLVIEDEKKKEQLLPIAYNQSQVVDSSFTVAVLGDLEANKNAEAVYQTAVDNGFMTEEVKNTLVGQINGAYGRGGTFARDAAFLNASLAAMNLMLAARGLGYDTCPMGGFNGAEFVKAFNVPERYVPVMLITVGKAAKPAHLSSRFSLEEVVVKNSF
ncbi:NAD(P)H nitroreductase [Halalkalibacterium halodurans C-125]|uniref:NAD(P)H nitroreductase n=1 Tax=Halalkalibacterium halodurans (strain ATCC BAA-125 / DSM 18197 / FERM 7344 / JCM 9153 / C-125) TaxID=272558 RepID=Q9KAQ1_HALH5|nr:nitroreductase family protein [Halalkalibacterium halodurans]BAB05955.1 NAD(P)H nitroreductase [Halalkalibacterium halodurans C-125]